MLLFRLQVVLMWQVTGKLMVSSNHVPKATSTPPNHVRLLVLDLCRLPLTSSPLNDML